MSSPRGQHPMLVLLVGSLLFAMCEGQPWGCIETSDSKGKGLQTVISETLNQNWCEDIDKTSTVNGLMDMCEGFCGEENIPFLVGIPTYGFALSDIDQICIREGGGDSLMDYAPDRMDDCKQWAKSLGMIQMKAAAFVAALDNMTYAQLVFRNGMHKQVQANKDAFLSDELEKRVKSADDGEVLSEFLDFMQPFFREFQADGELKRDLQAAMSVLSTSGKVLQETMGKHLPYVREYFEKCTTPLLATGTANEYMMDLCNQRTTNCVEEEGAYHVGCCCGAVPVLGTFGLSGEGTRRLSAEEDKGTVDVCGEASNLMKDDKAAQEGILQQTDYGQQLLVEHNARMQEAYPEFFAGYEGKCVGGGRRLHGVDVPEVSLQREVKVLPRSGEARNLQDTLANCEPQHTDFTNETLKVAFWKDTEEGFCDQVGGGFGTAGLADTCQAFCGANSVPLMLGNTAIGFNQSSMESVCGRAGDPINVDSDQVLRCHDDAKALKTVQAKAAAFIARLEILDSAKLTYEASIRATVNNMKENIKAEASDTIQAASVSDKIGPLWDLLSSATGSLTDTATAGSAKSSLESATDWVQKTGEDLSTVLGTALSSLEDLVNNCDKLFAGVGPDQEYLLDLCSQTSTDCVESPGGRHVGCCCGYVPLLTLGLDSIPVATIPGLSASDVLGEYEEGARVASRRLQEGSSVGQIYHVCAESWKQAKDSVSAADETIKELGADDLLIGAKQSKAVQYPEYYGGCVDGEPDSAVCMGGRPSLVLGAVALAAARF